MTEKSTPPEPLSLSRWSRRKLEANAEASAPPSAAEGPAPVNTMATAAPTAPAPAAAPELPSVDSLNFHSDFTAFLRPEVDEKLKRAALKQLFRDPRFNVMDGLDTYIDDYTKADPIAPEMLKDLLQRFSMAAAPASPSPPGDAPADEVPPATGAALETPPAPAPLPAASAEPVSAAEDRSEESPAPSSPS
jgi:Protein of unknown function (DUF3306)